MRFDIRLYARIQLAVVSLRRCSLNLYYVHLVYSCMLTELTFPSVLNSDVINICSYRLNAQISLETKLCPWPQYALQWIEIKPELQTDGDISLSWCH